MRIFVLWLFVDFWGDGGGGGGDCDEMTLGEWFVRERFVDVLARDNQSIFNRH
jgi:hypothetical protein